MLSLIALLGGVIFLMFIGLPVALAFLALTGASSGRFCGGRHSFFSHLWIYHCDNRHVGPIHDPDHAGEEISPVYGNGAHHGYWRR